MQNATKQSTDIGIVVNDENGARLVFISFRRFCLQISGGRCHCDFLVICRDDVKAARGLYVEHLIDEFCQLVGVTAQDSVEILGLRTSIFGFLCLCQLFEWSLDERQRCAQLMTHLSIEIELLTLHSVNLFIKTSPLQKVIIDTHNHQQQQEYQDESQNGYYFLCT